MKYSKRSVVFLIAAIILQLGILLTYTAEKSAIVTKGTEYRLRIQTLEFDDDKLILDYPVINHDIRKSARYAVPECEQNGVYQYMEFSESKPKGVTALKSSSVRKFRFPADEYFFEDAEHSALADQYWEYINSGHFFYSTVNIYQGDAVITGVFLDNGTPVEDIT